MKICFDFDALLYPIGFACEKKTVIATHEQSGDQFETDNLSDFWGHHSLKSGGLLAEYNKTRKIKRLPEEFKITYKQTPQPFSHAAKSMKASIKGYCEAIGTNSYYGYFGSGASFREGISTLLKYKGNRDNMLRPVLLDELREYCKKHHNAHLITNLEADDMVAIDSYKSCEKYYKTKNDSDKVIVVCKDKDYKQVPGWLFYMQNPGIDFYDNGLGWLKRDSDGSITGRGRKWLYFQALSGDSADNYKANCFSDVKWGDVKAFNALNFCKTDRECFIALKENYKLLYPEEKVVKGWRGDEIKIDWMYVLQENFTLARMLRNEHEKEINLTEVFKKLNI